MVAGEVGKPAPFLVADGKPRFTQEHAGALSGVRRIIDAPPDVVHNCGQTQQPRIRRRKVMPGGSYLGEPCGNPGDAIFMIDRAQMTLHPPSHCMVLGRSILAKLQHRAGLHAQ
jgi:hypothetical protein